MFPIPPLFHFPSSLCISPPQQMMAATTVPGRCRRALGRWTSWRTEISAPSVAEGLAQALQKFTGDEASAMSHQQPVFVHAGGQQGEERLVHAILQQSHLVVEVQGGEAGHGLGELRHLRDRRHRGVLTEQEDPSLHFSLLQSGDVSGRHVAQQLGE